MLEKFTYNHLPFLSKHSTFNTFLFYTFQQERFFLLLFTIQDVEKNRPEATTKKLLLTHLNGLRASALRFVLLSCKANEIPLGDKSRPSQQWRQRKGTNAEKGTPFIPPVSVGLKRACEKIKRDGEPKEKGGGEGKKVTINQRDGDRHRGGGGEMTAMGPARAAQKDRLTRGGA